MDIKHPDYNNSIVNLACSVLKHYGAENHHETLTIFDNYLKKNYKNVVVMLLDGLGVDALENHLDKGSFLRRHFVSEISTVFPPTTTAATTSIESRATCFYVKEEFIGDFWQLPLGTKALSTVLNQNSFYQIMQE